MERGKNDLFYGPSEKPFTQFLNRFTLFLNVMPLIMFGWLILRVFLVASGLHLAMLYNLSIFFLVSFLYFLGVAIFIRALQKIYAMFLISSVAVHFLRACLVLYKIHRYLMALPVAYLILLLPCVLTSRIYIEYSISEYLQHGLTLCVFSYCALYTLFF